MKKRNILNSPRLVELRKRRQRVFWAKAILGAIIFLAVFFGLVYISRTPVLNIDHINVVGNKVIDTETIQGIAQVEIDGNYLWFFPRANIFFYPRDDIRARLVEYSQRLKDIKISINKKTLEISLSERQGKYTWCGEAYLGAKLPSGEEGEQKCYFVDEDGYVFDEAPYFSGEVYFKFYGPKDGPYFHEVDFHRFVRFKEALASIGTVPVALFVPGGEEVKVFLSSQSALSQGPELIFKVDADLDALVSNLEAALSAEPFQSEFRDQYSSLEYIDLRFGNKVYYKFDE
jgi:hypothetical protein